MVFVTIQLMKYLDGIEKDHKHNRWIMEMRRSLLDNMYCGEKIRRDRIPSHYKNKHQVQTCLDTLTQRDTDPVTL